ncbi:MAG: GNAT family N-acetyltransferase [Ardenticatenaceae bacterium]|nr:GNAT family N-acetyltransferase [Ardenticatenaceae bacterium]
MLFGEKVTLRPFKKEDLLRAYEFENDVETRLLAQIDPPLPLSMAWLEAKFERQHNMADDPVAWFAIEADDKYIGKCGLNAFRQADQTCELGIEIGNKAYWGKGYGRDAVNLLLDYAFRLRNVRKVTLATSSHNERAIRAYRACGFVEEGRLHEQQWCNGRYVDWVFMGIFRRDWEQRDL